MAADTRGPGPGGLLVALLCALMIGLAAGAVWMLAALYARGESAWMALPVGAVLGYGMRGWVMPRPAAASVLAVLALALATVYMRALYAAAQIGAAMGIGFGEALRTAGPGMLLDLAHLSLNTAAVAFYLCGLAVAGLTAMIVGGGGKRP